MASWDGKEEASKPSDELIQLAWDILSSDGEPMSWESFLVEYKERVPLDQIESVQDLFCSYSVPGLLASRDFITLDTSRNTGLLKLLLVVASKDKLNDGQLSKVNKSFQLIASEDEADTLGKDLNALSNSIMKYPTIFNYNVEERSIKPKEEAKDLYKTFFASDRPLYCAIHKLKYFLLLCHGVTSISSAYEFARGLWTGYEKQFYDLKTLSTFTRTLKLSSIPLHLTQGDVALSSSHVPPGVSNKNEKSDKIIQNHGCLKSTQSLKPADAGEMDPGNSDARDPDDVAVDSAAADSCGVTGETNRETVSIDHGGNSSSQSALPDILCDMEDIGDAIGGLQAAAGRGMNNSDDSGFPKEGKLKAELMSLDELSAISKILKDGPSSWEQLSSLAETAESNIEVENIKERISQSSPRGFVLSPDFISLDNVKCTALVKLQFIVVIDNKLGNGQLGKVSYHFNVLGSEEERNLFGRSSLALSQTMLKYPDFFTVESDGPIGRRDVQCGPHSIHFHSFFGHEGKDPKGSFAHKLKYLLNLYLGKCSTFSAFEFARNLLTRDEKAVFQCSDQVFLKSLTTLSDVFSVSGQWISLRRPFVWAELMRSLSLRRKTHTTSDDKKSRSSSSLPTKTRTGKAVPLKQAPKVLSESFVNEVLVTHGYPMDWAEFKNQFMSSNVGADETIAKFMHQWSDRVSKLLCFSKDFVALNSSFHRNRLKLQLILEIRRKSAEGPIRLRHLIKQFKEIASEQEIEQTEIACDDFRDFLLKFPKVFIVEGNFVRQGPGALKFQSFFEREKGATLLSVLNKLNYFVNICGDFCNMKFACKFLQHHLFLEEEVALVDSDEKVMHLIEKSMSGALDSEIVRDTIPVSIPVADKETQGESSVHDKVKGLIKVLRKKGHAVRWDHMSSHFGANRGAVTLEDLRGSNFKVKESLILDMDFVSMDTFFDRAFLKLCLLAQLNVRYKGTCSVQELTEQFAKVASGRERREFYGDLALHLNRFPTVFLTSVESHEETYILPGADMVPFNGFFKCIDHSSTDCKICCLVSFMNISGRRCHCDKAFYFMNLVTVFRSKGKKNGMSREAFSNLIHNCQNIHSSEQSMICYSPQKSSDDCLVGTPNEKQPSSGQDDITTVSHDSKLAGPIIVEQADATPPLQSITCSELLYEVQVEQRTPLENDTQNYATRSIDTTSQSVTDNVTTSHHNTDDSSGLPAHPKENTPHSHNEDEEGTRSTSGESITSVTTEKRTRRRRGKKTPSTGTSIRAERPRVSTGISGIVQVINSDAVLAQTLSEMKNHEKAIVSVMCSHDTLVFLNCSQSGCVIPIPASSSNTFIQARWNIIRSFLEITKIIMVTFDCEKVVRFLLTHMDMTTCAVFDVKTAVELLLSKVGADRPAYVSVADLCRRLNFPGPDQIALQIVGQAEVWNGIESVQLDRERFTELACQAAALIPGVYSWIFENLRRLEGMNDLEELTKSKLRNLYSVEGIAPATSSVLTHSSSEGCPNPSSITRLPVSATNSTQRNGNCDPLVPSNANTAETSNALLGAVRPLVTVPNYPDIQTAPDSSMHSRAVLSNSHFIGQTPGSSVTGPLSNQSHAPTKLISSHPASMPHLPEHKFLGSMSFPSSSDQGLPFSYQMTSSPSSHESGSIPNPPIKQDQYPPHMRSTLPTQETSHLTGSHQTPQSITFQLGAQDSWFSEDTFQEVGLLTPRDEVDMPVQDIRCLCKEGDDIVQVPREEAGSYDNNLSGLTGKLLQEYPKKNRGSIEQLLRVLGEDITVTLGSYLQEHGKMTEMVEITLDAGRHAEARFHKSSQHEKQAIIIASSKPVAIADIQAIGNKDALTGFDAQHRCGVEGSLHSVRGVMNRKNKLVGLTIRIGLPRLGCAGMIYDIAQSGKSTLILGYPGVGKTTVLRELARCLSDNEKKRVVVIDTFNEIAGDSDCSHFSIGSARRFQVDRPENQHELMQDCAKSHSAEIIIVDQIDSGEDVRAVTRLAKSGIQVIGGTDRQSVQSLISDDNLSTIFQNEGNGFNDSISLDSAGALAKARICPVFEALVEMKDSDCWYIHDLGHTHSRITSNQAYPVQERRRIKFESDEQILLREIVKDQ